MRISFVRVSAVSALLSFTALAGVPFASGAGATPPALDFHNTAPISYLPVRGAVVHGTSQSASTFDLTAAGLTGRANRGSTVPSAPRIQSVSVGTGSVQLRWYAPYSGGSSITGYQVRYSSDAGATWTIVATGSTNRLYTVTGLLAIPYVFGVAATNSAGSGAWSVTTAPVTPKGSTTTVPGAPTITGLLAGTGSVRVSWNPPASDGGATITSYTVRDSSNGGATWSVATSSATASPFTVSGLTAGTPYVFDVAATNSVGTGAWSATSASATPTGTTTSNGIQYHGGPVLVNSVHVYEIWYGNWTTSSTPARQSLVDTFLHGIGGTPYFNTNASYYNAAGTYVTNAVSVMGSTTVSGSTSLNSNSFAAIVASTITSGALPADSNGVYFVFTSANVSVSGFLTQFCGFHSAEAVGSTTLQYAFVGDPTGSAIGNCAAQTSASPNGDPAGDAMVSVVAHELSEATTDPQLNAWYNTANGEENGDLCAWNFGAYFRVSNGSAANVTWTINGATYQYLIQQNWVNAAGGYCALSY